MRITFASHARDRMRERGISEEDVAYVLDNPDSVEKTPKNSVKLIGEPQPGRHLKVWVFPYAADSNVRRVKSTAWKDVEDV